MRRPGFPSGVVSHEPGISCVFEAILPYFDGSRITCVKSAGPIIPVMACIEETAPWSLPCSEGSTRWLMSDCAEGPAKPHSAITGMPARKTAPTGATP